jgi:hypothetical protein
MGLYVKKNNTNMHACAEKKTSGSMTVFINGVATEVPRGPIDLRSMFGQDVMLVHSTGGLLPVNEYGVLMQSLQMGESYFLVSLFIIHGISQYSTFPLMHLYIYIYI